MRWNYFVDLGELPADKKEGKDTVNYTKQWTPAADVELRSVVTRRPVLYLDEIATILRDSGNLNGARYSMTYISRRPRQLSFSRKVVHENATQAIAAKKAGFINTLWTALAKPEMAIFIDESKKDRKAAKRKYGWDLKGSDPNYHTLFNMDIRYTLIGAAGCFSFVQSACDTLMHAYFEKDQMPPLDSDRFFQYVTNYLVPNLGNYNNKEPHGVVIMDNCSIHIDPRVEKAIRDSGAIIVYSAPYSTELIIIESIFHSWKLYLKRHAGKFIPVFGMK